MSQQQGQKRKRAPKKKANDEPPAKKKLAYEMTDEETRAVVASEVKSHFAPKPPPPPKEIIPAKTVEHFVELLERAPAHVQNRPSDYERSIRKSYQEQMQQSRRTSSNKSGKTVPQLGEQAMQSIPPLKVITDKVTDAARDIGISVDQLLGTEEVPVADVAWQYAPGKTLVRPEQVPHLSTQMRRLHEWYMKEVKNGREMLMVKVKEEHYFYENELCIEFPEIFQLYNQDALDKSIVSCYCL
jgi:hypothetical protein